VAVDVLEADVGALVVGADDVDEPVPLVPPALLRGGVDSRDQCL